MPGMGGMAGMGGPGGGMYGQGLPMGQMNTPYVGPGGPEKNPVL